MAHETHAASTPIASRRAGRTGLCRRLEDARAYSAEGLCSRRRGSGISRPARIDHVLRAWVLGLMLTFGWSVGGLALLMVQYCSGGKWGLLLRRPLEAMTRTLPLVFAYWVVSRFS